jgi:hypothetical protein
MTKPISALFVQKNGSYFGLPNIDPWPEERDAMTYAGPNPVIAHPPCQRWGRFWAGSPAHIARTGIRRVKGDDGGCFKSALESVRAYGGVLEHPEGSHAWAAFGLNKPPRSGGWVPADSLGGWTCCVEQGRYGHWMRKPTWLYAFNTERPELKWGVSKPQYPLWAIERYGIDRVKRMGEIAFKGGGKDSTARIFTPPEFRAVLIEIASSCYK